MQLREMLSSFAAPLGALANRLVEKRLGGYERAVHRDDPSLPERVGRPVRAAVLGGGIAGMTTAATLAERGVSVTLFERNGYLGGKIGAWTETLEDGDAARIEHGFHAFFRNYYNLRRMAARIGATAALTPIADYMIVRRDGRTHGFHSVAKTPGLNLLSLSRVGVFSPGEMLRNPRINKLEAFLRYEREATFRDLDELPFARFADQAGLPADLRFVFNSFARAFFAEPERMSTAELVKSFHFYYLSNDGGLVYDYLADDHGRAFNEPFGAYLARLGVTLRLGAAVSGISPGDGARLTVGGEPFDHVVLACDVPGARAIAAGSRALLAAHADFASRIDALATSQRYANLRIWLDRDVARQLPVFVITEGERLLDSLTANHRIAPEPRAWAEAHGGGVFELHCYAVPDAVPDDAAIERALLAEFRQLFPEARAARVLRRHLQVKRDFPAFGPGMHARRPGTVAPVAGLYLAGDWVELPHPAMLMEAACMSGLLASNAIFEQLGLRAAPVYAVPDRGLLAPR